MICCHAPLGGEITALGREEIEKGIGAGLAGIAGFITQWALIRQDGHLIASVIGCRMRLAD